MNDYYKERNGFEMKNRKGALLSSLQRLTCLVLVLCMCIGFGIVPAVAEDGAAPSGDTVKIVVAAEDLAHGTKVTEKLLAYKEIKNVNVPQCAVYNMEEALGMFVDGSFYEGEYIYADKLSKTKLAEDNSDLLTQQIGKSSEKYVNVGDYIPPDSGKDVASLIQKLIDSNPQRTIFFPEGEYIIGQPIVTDGRALKSVSLYLSAGTVIKASDKWSSTEAMIRLGGKEPELGESHEINSVGTYYSLYGGVIDANGKANGVAIESGRETLVKNVTIMNAKTGLTIKKAKVYGSTDADVDDITIIGNGALGTIGLRVVGFDCSATNVNIYDVETGASIEGGGTLMKNINVYYTHGEHLTNTLDKKYAQTVGIYASASDNWFYDCYVENYATAFKLNSGIGIIDRSTACWTSDEGGKQTMFEFTNASKWNNILGVCRAIFSGSGPNCAFVKCNGGIGNGCIEGAMFNENLCDDKTYKNNLRTPVIPVS